MKTRKSPNSVYLVNEKAREAAHELLSAQPVDGTMKVTVSGAKDKSARQRGLQWLWYGDVVASGLGGMDESTSDRLHVSAKARWCLPILCRDDDAFADIYLTYYQKWKDAPDWAHRFYWFCDRVVSTEDLNQAQMAEYLKLFQEWYGFEIGVELTDPGKKGWDNLLEVAA